MDYPKKIFRILFITYCIVMLWLLFGQRAVFWSLDDYLHRLKENVNLIPFRTISNYLKYISNSSGLATTKQAIINLIGNIVMFIPLGFLLPFNLPKTQKFVWCILVSAGLILCVEIIQLVMLLGSFDVDDLIFNIIGAIAGYVCYLIYCKLRQKKSIRRN